MSSISLAPFWAIPRIRLAVCCLLPALSGAANAATSEDQEFARIAKPFFEKHCVSCHGPEKQKGKLTLHNINPNITNGSDTAKWDAVLEVLELGEMPPEEKPRPESKELQRVVTWILRELETADRPAAAGRHSDPHYGNYLDHNALFSGKHKGPAWSPSRLWRISPFISTGRYKSGPLSKSGIEASQPFSPSDSESIKDYATMWRMDGPTLELLMLNANEVVKAQIGPPEAELERMNKEYLDKGGNPYPAYQPGNRIRNRTVKEFREMAYGTKTPSREQLAKVVTMQCRNALGREPSAAEKANYVKLLSDGIRDGGNMEGTHAALVTILLAPEAIYRMELGLGETGSSDRRMLSAQELSFALSYALRDIGPDKHILADARSGKLLEREVIAGHVRRMIDEELTFHYKRTQSPRYLRFFREFFGYTTAPQVFKDGSRHPGYKPRPDTLVGDTDALINHILKKDKNVLKELLTTDEVAVYVFQKDFRLTYPAYGIPRGEAHAYAKAKKKSIGNGRGIFSRPGERAGILTQPSWLTAHSTNFDNDPVRRGKWIWERLLAGTVPDTPITVDAVVPEDHDRPLRARFEKTRDTYCWKCHKKLNPLGMVFEMYDDVGRFRSKGELLRDNKTVVPVVSTGGIPGVGDEVANVSELMEKLAAMPRVRQSFIRHAFRYYMGRNEHLDDSPTLMAAEKAYLESGGSMKELVVSLLTSDSFLYRKDSSPPRGHGSPSSSSLTLEPASKPSGPLHLFRNVDGSKSFKAHLMNYDSGTKKVTVRREDGNIMTFALHHLHSEDQSYILNQSQSTSQ